MGSARRWPSRFTTISTAGNKPPPVDRWRGGLPTGTPGLPLPSRERAGARGHCNEIRRVRCHWKIAASSMPSPGNSCRQEVKCGSGRHIRLYILRASSPENRFTLFRTHSNPRKRYPNRRRNRRRQPRSPADRASDYRLPSRCGFSALRLRRGCAGSQAGPR